MNKRIAEKKIPVNPAYLHIRSKVDTGIRTPKTPKADPTAIPYTCGTPHEFREVADYKPERKCPNEIHVQELISEITSLQEILKLKDSENIELRETLTALRSDLDHSTAFQRDGWNMENEVPKDVLQEMPMTEDISNTTANTSELQTEFLEYIAEQEKKYNEELAKWTAKFDNKNEEIQEVILHKNIEIGILKDQLEESRKSRESLLSQMKQMNQSMDDCEELYESMRVMKGQMLAADQAIRLNSAKHHQQKRVLEDSLMAARTEIDRLTGGNVPHELSVIPEQSFAPAETAQPVDVCHGFSALPKLANDIETCQQHVLGLKYRMFRLLETFPPIDPNLDEEVDNNEEVKEQAQGSAFESSDFSL